MNEYDTPIAKLGERVLVAKKVDIPKIGKEKAMQVMVQQWNLDTERFEGEFPLEDLLRFNHWNDIIDNNEVNKLRVEIMKIVK